MEPLPETIETVEEFGPFARYDLLVELREASARVAQVVPSCVGLSLAVLDQGVTLTLVATRAEIAALDADQHATDGSALESVRADRVVAVDHDDLLDEQGWRLFARATAAEGIESTVTFPIMTGGRVSGSINLYAAVPGAFDGHHEAVAEIFGAWAPGAVADADLSFSTRREAQAAPARQRDELRLLRAAALLADLEHVEPGVARARIEEAWSRTGVPDDLMAETILRSLDDPDAVAE